MTDIYDPPRVIREKFPLTLPIELALGIDSVKNLCASYDITKEEWDVLREDPLFVRAVEAAVKMLEKEGMSFRLKARMQAEELLKTSWNLIHKADVPAVVKADLIKATVKWADYEPKQATPTPPGAGFSIQINLGGQPLPDTGGNTEVLEGEFGRLDVPGATAPS